MFRFAEMILRDRCSASYDLISLFRGRRITLDRWCPLAAPSCRLPLWDHPAHLGCCRSWRRHPGTPPGMEALQVDVLGTTEDFEAVGNNAMKLRAAMARGGVLVEPEVAPVVV